MWGLIAMFCGCSAGYRWEDSCHRISNTIVFLHVLSWGCGQVGVRKEEALCSGGLFLLLPATRFPSLFSYLYGKPKVSSREASAAPSSYPGPRPVLSPLLRSSRGAHSFLQALASLSLSVHVPAESLPDRLQGSSPSSLEAAVRIWSLRSRSATFPLKRGSEHLRV